MHVCVSSEDQMLPVLAVRPCVYPYIKMAISADTETLWVFFQNVFFVLFFRLENVYPEAWGRGVGG